MPMRSFAFIVVLAILCFACINSSNSETWVHAVTASEGKEKSFVDVDAITIDGDKRTFQIFHEFKGGKSVDGKPVEKVYWELSVNCKERTILYGNEHTIELQDGSKEVKSMEFAEEKVRPNSVDEGLLKFACNFKPEF